MRLTYRDAIATLLVSAAAAVYGAFLANAGIAFIDSVRGAAGAILLLGIGACAAGAKEMDRLTGFAKVLGLVGTVAFFAAVVALIWASEVALAIQIGAIVALWAVTTVRHAVSSPPQAITPADPNTKVNVG